MIGYAAVQDQLASLLKSVSPNDDRYRALSRRVVDALLPAMRDGQMQVRSPRALSVLCNLLDNVAPAALRPLELVLLTAVDVAAGPVMAELDGDVQHLHELVDWLPVLLVLLRVVASNSEQVIITGLDHVLRQQGIAVQGDDNQQAAVTWIDLLFRAIAHGSRALASDAVVASSFVSQLIAQLMIHTAHLLRACGPGSPLRRAALTSTKQYGGRPVLTPARWHGPLRRFCAKITSRKTLDGLCTTSP